MSYLVLARKYRPKTFDEVVEQSHVTQTLKNAVSSGRVAHAILFSGPRGTGKTTVARILAKIMNCQNKIGVTPCNKCRSCMEITAGNAVDVLEIDGASNNGVEQIRELRENIKYMPSHSRYKIYIIDEVHMLTTAAFNALLKTLEEPPSHILFMFATTEPHKIPITILSRCQRHDLRRISLESITKHIEMLCEKESAPIDRESLWLIAREAGGSMRDALSLLDQIIICSEDRVTSKHVLDILGLIDRKFIFDLSTALLQGDMPESLNILDELYDRGYEIKKLCSDLTEHFRNLLIVKFGKKIDRLVDVPAHEIDIMKKQVESLSAVFLNQIFNLLFKEESMIKFSSQPKLALEMIFIKITSMQPALSLDDLIKKIDKLQQGRPIEQAEYNLKDNKSRTSKQLSRQEVTGLSIKSQGADKAAAHQENAFANKNQIEIKEKLPEYNDKDNIETIWKKLLITIENYSQQISSYIEDSKLKSIDDKSITIELDGNQIQINRTVMNKKSIERICSDFFKKEMVVNLNQNKTKTPQNRVKKYDEINRLKQEAMNHPIVRQAIEIFNGKLVDVNILK
ncbi:DNA polymerase III subunit gamma/tau [Candidatus Magnetomoraceae bacterium gMMP-1]